MHNEAFAKAVITWEREEQKPEKKKVEITRFERKKKTVRLAELNYHANIKAAFLFTFKKNVFIMNSQ